MTGLDAASLDWSKGDGLLPAVIQDATNGAVLMVGFMNREALESTLDSGRVTFFSRSRRTLWVKGEISGNFLAVTHLSIDCDGDAILVQASPAGPVCHAGTPTCFPQAVPAAASDFSFLAQLDAVIADRIDRPTASSYTANLHAEGPKRIAQKVGEEGLEVALAAAAGSDTELIAESADLLYHLALALRSRGLSLAACVEQLERRHRGRARQPLSDLEAGTSSLAKSARRGP